MHAITPLALTILFSLLSGTALWFWLFALAFTRSYADYWTDAVLPLSLAAVASGVLGYLSSKMWYLVAVLMPLPVTLMNLTCLSMVYAEGRGFEWSYIWSIAAVVGVSFSASLLGCGANWLSHRQGPNQPLP